MPLGALTVRASDRPVRRASRPIIFNPRFRSLLAFDRVTQSGLLIANLLNRPLERVCEILLLSASLSALFVVFFIGNFNFEAVLRSTEMNFGQKEPL